MWMGQKIRSRRKDIGITRNDLADRLHVTPSTIANYENGISYPKPDILISLIEALQIHVEQYEPVYKKYAVLAMKHEAAKHNQIGIFRLNKLYYLRTLYKTPECCRLHSLNVNEPDIEIKEDDQFECIGTVLGQVYGTYEIIREEIPKTENE